MTRQELLAQWLAKVIEDGDILPDVLHHDGKVYAIQFILALANDFAKLTNITI